MVSQTRSFRDALGCYPTGVTIVSTFVDGVAMGITVNSFASLSLDPMLLLWSVDRTTDRHALFERATDYAINVLAHDQSDLAQACAQEAQLDRCGAMWLGEQVPLLEGAVARFTCRQTSVVPGGDHDIIIGRVENFDAPRDVPALVFYRGGYAQPG